MKNEKIKKRQDNINLYLWMEGNKIYFETYNDFVFTSIKIYFISAHLG